MKTNLCKSAIGACVMVTLLIVSSSRVFSDPADSDHSAHHANGSTSSIPAIAPLAPLERALENNPPTPSKKKKTKRAQGMSQSMPKMENPKAADSPGGMSTAGGGGGMMGKDMMAMMGSMMGGMRIFNLFDGGFQAI